MKAYILHPDGSSEEIGGSPQIIPKLETKDSPNCAGQISPQPPFDARSLADRITDLRKQQDKAASRCINAHQSLSQAKDDMRSYGEQISEIRNKQDLLDTTVRKIMNGPLQGRVIMGMLDKAEIHSDIRSIIEDAINSATLQSL
jgi:hypothetical protein